jgi:hypothetical protein
VLTLSLNSRLGSGFLYASYGREPKQTDYDYYVEYHSQSEPKWIEMVISFVIIINKLS